LDAEEGPVAEGEEEDEQEVEELASICGEAHGPAAGRERRGGWVGDQRKRGGGEGEGEV
jgi:hypothetical protein